jgi:hypothetical protein
VGFGRPSTNVLASDRPALDRSRSFDAVVDVAVVESPWPMSP